MADERESLYGSPIEAVIGVVEGDFEMGVVENDSVTRIADSDPVAGTVESSAPFLQLIPGYEDSLDAEEQWQERALCAQTDPEAFFPEKGGSTREAKRICMGCEVRDDCLEYALAHDERFGIWGGLSERERRRLKRGIV